MKRITCIQIERSANESALVAFGPFRTEQDVVEIPVQMLGEFIASLQRLKKDIEENSTGTCQFDSELIVR